MYDAIVVGARCAGAATAMLLARRGLRVLLVDRDRFPSDMVMSTHLIWQSGAALLEKWGLLETVKDSGCPPLAEVFLDLGEFELSGRPVPSGATDSAFAPRRFVLDPMLVEAAVRAGVELREEFSFKELLREGDRVVGIEGRDSSGARVQERAQLVIGADGRNSHVARAAGAATQEEHPKLQGTYFSYFSNVPLRGIEFTARPGRMVYAWSTNDDASLVGISWQAAEYRELSSSIDTVWSRELEQVAPDLASRVAAGKRSEDWHGGAIPGVCRRATGPGWALVGDAGLTMDPITAEGITNAFRDAELLAEAVDEGLSSGGDLDASLAAFETRRNEASLPLFGYTAQTAALAEPPPEMGQLFLALRDNPTDLSRYFGVLGQTVSVPEFFDPANLQRIVTGAG